jgi:cell division protein FtsZ
MKGMGHAVMGIGMGEGPMRALTAAQRAVSNPLLENSSMQGARSIVVNITGGPDLSLAEASEATSFITRVADPDANVIYGIVTNENLRNAVRVTVIATGFEQQDGTKVESATRRGPAAAASPANGRNGNGHANGNGQAAAAEPEAAEPARRGVGGFMRRMWGRGSAQV